MSPQQRAAFAQRMRAMQAKRRAPATPAALPAAKPRRKPMSRRAALGVVVLGALVVGAIAAGALARAMTPVFAYAASTQSQAIRTAPAVTPATPRKAAAKPTAVNHCATNRAGQLVLVDLKTQHAWYCAGHRTVYSTPITSGRATASTATPLGHFTVRAKLRDTVLSPGTGEHYPVQYWIAFKGSAYGFHDASWQTIPFGSAQYATGGSHGCVHLPLLAVRYLYSWVHVGARVTITAR